MSVSIIPCPSCKTLLLSDTAQCPTCQHVLNPELAESGEGPAEPVMPEPASEVDESSGEMECPDCGETVRKELVRCWQCGTFLRKDIEESYQQKRQNIERVSFAPLPEHTEAEDSAPLAPTSTDDDGDDFELAPGVGAPLAPLPQEAAAAPAPLAPEAPAAPAAQPAAAAPAEETYSLQPVQQTAETTVPPAPATEAAPPAPEAPSAETPAAEAQPSEAAPSTDAPEAAAAADQSSPPGDEAAKPADAPEGGESHSVATGGDALLDIALKEEKEIKEGRKLRASTPSLGSDDIVLTPGSAIFCYAGSGKAEPVPLQSRPQGLLGKCQSCNVSVFIPNESWYEQRRQKKQKKVETEAQAEAAQMEDKFNRWLTDVRIHTVDPQKLKLKAGAMEAAFEPFDIGFSKDEMLLASLASKAGLFGKSDKKVPEAREAMLAYIKEGQPIEGLPATTHWVVSADDVKQMPIAHPAPYAHESMFAGIAVFGEGRIAIKIPQPEGSSELKFASLTLTEFRELSTILGERFDVTDYGEVLGVPLQNKTEELKCHYSEEEFEALQDLEYYQADPKLPVKLVGRRCQECGLVVSEDARKKEKIGGAAGKGIAKAKCPKCEQKFGDISLFALDEDAIAAMQPAEEPAEAPAEADSDA